MTLGVTGVAMSAITTFFMQQARTFSHQTYRLEAQQALRSSLDNITRDLRLGGACLPTGGAFLPLAGVNDPAGDSLTVRTGLVAADGSCIKTSLASATAANAGASAITVAAGTGANFAAGMLIYVRADNGSGEIHTVSARAGDVLSITPTLQQGYTNAGVTKGGVYAMDERKYSLDKSNAAAPLLILEANRTGAQAFAVGVFDMQVQYILDRNCPTCDTVDLPADDIEWGLVNEVKVSLAVKPVGSDNANDSNATFTGDARAKPRNLLP